MHKAIQLSVALFGFTCGCASVGAPQQRYADSQSELRAAEAVGADKEPKAALHVQLAKESIDKAKGLMDAGKYERADFLLQRAQVDAELAIAIAKNAPLIQKAEETKAQLEKIKAQHAASAN